MRRPIFSAVAGIVMVSVWVIATRAAVPTAEVPTLPLGSTSDTASPMTLLIRAGDLGAVRQLLDVGDDPNGPPGVRPPLVEAALACRPRVAMLLLQRGADVDVAFGPSRMTPLLAAVQSFCPSVARLLLEHGADPHAATRDGVTPLMAAAWWGSTDCLRLLLAQDPDLLAVDHQGHDGVYLAALRGHASCLSLLLDAGADASRGTVQGWTPMLAAARSGCARCVTTLLKHHAGVGKQGPRGETPLDEAASHCHPEVVNVLLAAGATATRHTMETSIDHACPSVLTLLLSTSSTWDDARRQLRDMKVRVERAVQKAPLTEAIRRRLDACNAAIDKARIAVEKEAS